jgi:hypothetical protein
MFPGSATIKAGDLWRDLHRMDDKNGAQAQYKSSTTSNRLAVGCAEVLVNSARAFTLSFPFSKVARSYHRQM